MAQQSIRLRDTTLTAPIGGTVQGLAVRNVGQAIRPSDPLMQIVPDTEGLVIEAKVSSEDIGFVRVGQATIVKVRTYDYFQYGGLNGTVQRIAADAAEDRQTGTFSFVVTVRTDKTYLGAAPGELPVLPGMLVDVELKAGERSILSYLTDRVLATADGAFKER